MDTSRPTETPAMHRLAAPRTTENFSLAGTTIQASKPHPYPFWAPRFWHGMSHGPWVRLLARNRFAISPSAWFLAASVNSATILNSFAGVFTKLVFSHRARATKL